MVNNKKSMFGIGSGIGIFGIAAIVFSLLMLTFLVPKLRSEAQETETFFKTADGQMIQVIRDDTAETADDIEEMERDGDAEDEDVYYGAVFTRDGVTERVYAIAEDGSFITEVLEDNIK